MTTVWVVARPNETDYHDTKEDAMQQVAAMTPEQRKTALVYPMVVEPEVRPGYWERGEGVA